jgi:3'-5' exoribonuclease
LSEIQFFKSGQIKKLQVSSKFKFFGVLSRMAARKDRNNKTFWDISLMDEEGVIEGKVWANAQWWDRRDPDNPNVQLAPELINSLQGMTVGVQGQVAEFKGQTQFNFNALYFVDQKKYPPHSFVQKSPVPLDVLESGFNTLLAKTTGQLRAFLDFIFRGDFLEKFKAAPAAVSHHHAYVHGLLEHTVSVAGAACSLAEKYAHSGYPVDVEMTVAGAILHDIGKIDAYRLSPAPEMTTPGIVHDHIAIGFAEFSRFASEFDLDENLRNSLGHILLSHHGRKEYGSPVLPATPEALIVSASDELDFKLFCFEDAVREMENGRDVTEFNYSTQRRFWKWKDFPERQMESSQTLKEE